MTANPGERRPELLTFNHENRARGNLTATNFAAAHFAAASYTAASCAAIVFVLGATMFSTLGPVLRADERPAAEADGGAVNGAAPDEEGYRERVTPFLRKHCLRCHGPEKPQGEFRVDKQLPNAFLDASAKEKWGEVVNVLNSHEMPPEKEPQPAASETAAVVDWITAQIARAELVRRDRQIVLRRLNRDEYRNTLRELTGVDFDTSGFPQDPPASGFDNIGAALTLSPLHTELYLDAARKILDRALVEGEQPPTIRWRFEPESGDSDSNRVNYDGQRAIVNGGRNPVRDGFKILHHESWDKNLNARDFRLKSEGDYVVRIRAGGRVPKRDEVVESARKKLTERMDRENEKNPSREKWHREQLNNDLQHFQTDRMYDYGPPRLKVVQALGGQPRVIAEFDVDAPLDSPRVYEIPSRFTTESAGLTLHYAYDIPKVLENFWFQGHDEFARPEAYVDWFEIEGPIYASWPPPSHLKILPKRDDATNDDREYARKVLKRFMSLAYRRLVTDDEVAEKLRLYEVARTPETSFVQAIKTPLVAVLVSPNFLYLVETGRASETAGDAAASDAPAGGTPAGDVANSTPPNAAPAPRKLTDFELASRLSYFLWSTMPDAELLRLARDGRLGDPAALDAQVDRMLADAKSAALSRNFAAQWLGLREVGANPPAMDLYPQYDRHLEISISEESRAFFNEILRHDLSMLNFVGSDFVVINERLARFYDIPDVRGDQFRRVAAPPESHRGGVVTQASVLTITSNGTRTSPVKRGTWVMKNLLGTDPGLPVANAGDIAPKVPGIDRATVRQRLEIHRQLPQCARCHDKIDPLGFALENFNAAGQWRDQEGFGYKGRVQRGDPRIDASSKLPDGTSINGVDDLRRVLREKEELFLRCLSGKLFTYALGRELGVADHVRVQASVEHVQRHDYTLRSLIKYIVASDLFQTK